MIMGFPPIPRGVAVLSVLLGREKAPDPQVDRGLTSFRLLTACYFVAAVLATGVVPAFSA